MKVLQINKYPSVKGGTETVLFDTLRLLGNRGHEVVLFSTDEGQVIHQPTYTVAYPRRNAPLSEKLKRLPSFFYNRQAAQMLEQIIEKEKPDIAHIHLYLNSFSSSILPVLQKHRIPIVMTLHEYRQICPSYLLLDKQGRICEKCTDGNYLHCLFTRCGKGGLVESGLLSLEMFYRRTFYKTETFVDTFVFPSHFVYGKHLQFNPKIANKGVVIYNPVGVPHRSSAPKGDYLLYFGRLSAEKGLATLVSAMKQLPHLKLVIAGLGDISLGDIPPNVELVGFKEKEDLNRLIGNARYTVVPSQSYETFGLSCTESLAQGTPVIASEIGAIPEIIEHGTNGFLVEAGNVTTLAETIEKAMQLSSEQYQRMVNEGYESLAKFSEDLYTKSLLSVYEQCIKNRGHLQQMPPYQINRKLPNPYTG